MLDGYVVPLLCSKESIEGQSQHWAYEQYLSTTMARAQMDFGMMSHNMGESIMVTQLS